MSDSKEFENPKKTVGFTTAERAYLVEVDTDHINLPNKLQGIIEEHILNY